MAKQCVINAFDTDFIMSADREMGSIIHHAHNLDAEDHAPPDSDASAQLLNAFLADRKRQGGRRLGGLAATKRLCMSKLLMKCGACGDPNHVWPTCKAPDADVLRMTSAKRKQSAKKYAGHTPPTAHLSDVAAASATQEDGTECPPE
jgi:hypothetical protein